MRCLREPAPGHFRGSSGADKKPWAEKAGSILRAANTLAAFAKGHARMPNSSPVHPQESQKD